MKLFICCSKWFYDKIPEIKEKLEELGHIVTLPNSYEEPMKEEEIKKSGNLEKHIKFKRLMFKQQIKKIEDNDGILILNFNKNQQMNYIGGATFLEMYDGWRYNKYLFLYNNIPNNILRDEIIGLNPRLINKDLTKIK